jgi:hypothetical protein
MINLTSTLVDSAPTSTTALLTLLLNETFVLTLAGLLFIVVLVLVLLIPVFYLSRPKSGGTAKLVALGLCLLPIWLGSGGWLKAEFGYMKYGWLASSFYYLPLGIVFVNLIRTLPIIFPENKQQGGS